MSLADPAVEAFDEAVGLWPIRSGQAVINVVVGADEIERVMAGRPARRLVLHIDGKAVGELGAIVGSRTQYSAMLSKRCDSARSGSSPAWRAT